MVAADVVIFSLGILLMLAGAAGAFVPVIPGLPLNWLVLLGYGFWSGWGPYGFWTMFLTALAVAAGMVGDQLAGAMGARKFGSGKAGMIGAAVGAILGVIVFNIPGLVLGTFFGAMLAEIWFNKKEAKEAADAGLGALLGCLAGGMFKFVLSVVITVAFIWQVLAYDPPPAPAAQDPIPAERPLPPGNQDTAPAGEPPQPPGPGPPDAAPPEHAGLEAPPSGQDAPDGREHSSQPERASTHEDHVQPERA
ncbi:MAG: DUF456 domain-containing protein [Deltaproteobacteria bacterium]|jgi:uncharacterized protein YqgC (DUF456 family)|nr:DUF456 domain-containing protein [Deltaproteobacteria bacterium]